MKRKLEEVQAERFEVEASSLNMDDTMANIMQEYDPREDVRDEIERGDTNFLKRFWGNIRMAGANLVGRFKSIFELLKQKAGFHWLRLWY